VTASVLIAATGVTAPQPDVAFVSPLVIVPRFADMKRTMSGLGQWRTIALTSPHAVDGVVGALRALGHDVRALFGIKLAAVGDATAERLGQYGLSADLVAHGGGAELAREIIAADLPDPILHPRAADGRPELADALTAAGKRVEVALAYDSRPDAGALKAALLRHAAEPYAAIGFASPQGFAALLSTFGAQRLAGVRLGAIGATTAAAMTAAGFADVRVPERPSLEALIEVLRDV
jgi:uroporphyrinogen-III synthase